MKKMRKCISFILALIMMVSIVPMYSIHASAASFDPVWPCNGYEVSCLYYYESMNAENNNRHGTRYGYTHAIDIASSGDAYAIEDGIVETVVNYKNDTSGFGNHVIIKHNNGSKSLYGHLASYSVSVNQTVSKGQKIGVVGGSGKGTLSAYGVHLHLEINNADPWYDYYCEKYCNLLRYESNVYSNNKRKLNAGDSYVKNIVSFIENNCTYSGGCYVFSGEKVQHIVDHNYGTNFTAKPNSYHRTQTFDHSLTPSGWTDENDTCTIIEVYTDGCCRFIYPLNSGGTKEAFGKIEWFNYTNFNATVSAGVSAAQAALSISTKSSALTTSQLGIDFIKNKEGLRKTAYQDSAGKWTIGYGHTGGVYSGMTISEAQAESFLRSDLYRFENALKSFLAKYNRTLTQNQFDAMVSFSFNVGEGWMSDSSYNINKYIRTGNYTEADFIETMQAWSNAGGSRLQGLVTRRTEEAYMFLYGQYPGGVVSKGTQNTQVHEIDNSYGTNFTAYPKNKITASNIYNENHQTTSSSAWIGTSDRCTIHEVYTDGCCKVTYPLDAGGSKNCYSKISLFSCEPLVKVPGKTNITLTTATDIPVGGIMTVTWTNASDADYYYVALKNSSGNTVKSIDNVKGNTASFTLDTADSYTVSVTAKNSKYSGAESQLSSRVTAHKPLTVSFVDYDGSVISKQTKVDYGTNAVVPPSPSRTGYTFSGWSGTYTNVKSNQTVTAQYTKNKYTVKFLDENGKVLDTQKVYYLDAAMAPNYQPNAGYYLSGWNRSFGSITEDTTIKAVVSWYNDDMSCLISNVKAERDTDGTGVNVTYTVTNQKGEITSARAIVALKTSAGKLVTTTESAAFSIKNNFPKKQEVFVPTTDAAYTAEVYIVANYKTAVPISDSASAVIDQGTMNWSSWSTTKPSGISSSYIESRTEYRYRDKKYTTGPSSSKTGWTLYDSSWAWGDYGSWSGWSDSKVSSSDSRQVETRQAVASYNYKTVYTYYRFANSSGSEGNHTQTDTYWKPENITLDSPLTDTSWGGGYKWWYNGTNYKTMWKCADWGSQVVTSTNYKTQYRYRDRSKVYTYKFWQWGDYTSWSANSITANSDRQVETRTVYRYRTNDIVGTENSSGVERTVSGRIPAIDYESYYDKIYLKYMYVNPAVVEEMDENTFDGNVFLNYIDSVYHDGWISNADIFFMENTTSESFTGSDGTKGYFDEEGFPFYAVKAMECSSYYFYVDPEIENHIYDADYDPANYIDSVYHDGYEYVEIPFEGICYPFGLPSKKAFVGSDGSQGYYFSNMEGVIGFEQKNKEPLKEILRTVIDENVDFDLSEYAGKEALLMIYKVDEASDYSNQYTQQLTIGNDGTYSATFKLLDEPTVESGDYTVMLGVAGTNEAFYVDTIKAPKAQHTVTFYDDNGNIVSRQTVLDGENADVPDAPEKEGYRFIYWDHTGTNIKDDTDIYAHYEKLKYTVVFVNWTDETVQVETYEHGQLLTPPVLEDTDSSKVVGWDVVLDGDTVVTENMVITARYETKTFIVKFLDWDNNVISEQTVEYGASAIVPPALEEDDYVFFSWTSNEDYENVTADTIVVPLYHFEETVANPVISIEDGDYTSAQTVTITCDDSDATIYYTIDGSDPSAENAIEYTGAFTISKTTQIKAIACAFHKNDSEIMTKYVTINGNGVYSEWVAYDDIPDYVLNNLSKYSLVSETGYRYKDTISTDSLNTSKIYISAGWIENSRNYGEWSEWAATYPIVNDLIEPKIEEKDPDPVSTTVYEYTRWKYKNSKGNYVYSKSQVKGTSGSWEILDVENALSISAFDGTDKVYTYNGENWYNQKTVTKNVTPDYKLYRYSSVTVNYSAWSEWQTTAPRANETRQYETGEVYRFTMPKQYVVTFVDTLDDSIVRSIEIGGLPVQYDMSEFEKTGYTFDGAYTDPEFSQAWDIANDNVVDSMTLYLKWLPNTYTVIFKGFNGEIIDTQQVDFAEYPDFPTFPDVDGYVFCGIDAATLFITGDLTVNAIYVKEEDYVTVKLDKNSFSMFEGTSFTLKATITPAEEAEASLYWYTSDEKVAVVDDSGVVTAVAPGNVTIMAVVNENGYSAVCDITVLENAENVLTLNTGSALKIDEAKQLRGLKPDVNTVAAVKTQFANTEIEISDKDGNALADEALVGTGAVIKLTRDGEVIDEITVVVTGDTNGDGKVNNRDVALLTRYLVNKEVADIHQLTAMDTNGDGKVNNRDSAMLARYLVGKETL